MTEMKHLSDLTELVEDSELSNSEATVVWDAAKRRVETSDGSQQVIVVCDEWVTYDNYEILDERVVVAASCESVTEDAYYVEGAATVDVSQQDADWLTDVVSTIDKSDTDYVDDRGESYLPKSAVMGLYVVT